MKRAVAKRVRIRDLRMGRFFYGSRENLKANYVITPFGEKITRVNIVGTVTDKFVGDNYATITLDDGSSSIRVKSFGDETKVIEKVEKGDVVNVIGKVKEFNGEIYVNAEIVRKVGIEFEVMRKMELLLKLREKKKMIEDLRNIIESMSEEEIRKYMKEKYGLDFESLQVVRDNLSFEENIDYTPKVMKLIESLDKGEGVEVEKIFKISELPEGVIESAITELLSSGLIYEPKPGVVKKVGS